MNNVEKRLVDEKKRMDSIMAPVELEMRLRNALNSATPKRSRRISPIWKIAAVVLLVTIITGNNYNAFAYYGKLLLGFDEVIDGTLQRLNNEGMGQIIEEKTTLVDGTDLVINGMMSDANQLIVYYTLSNPNGIEDTTGSFFVPTSINGFLTDSKTRSGGSDINENHTEIKGTISFDSVSPFSKELTLHFWNSPQNGQRKEGEISFPYDPNKAMQTQVEQSLDKKVKVDKGTITFKSIKATPTMTEINGTMDVENYYKVDFAIGGIKLIVNGTLVAYTSGGTSRSSDGGTEFYIRYESLPQQLDSLEIVTKEFAGYQLLEEKVSLADLGDEPITLEGKEIWVKNVSKSSHGVEITILTDADVLLDGVSIEIQNKITPLKEPVKADHYVYQADGREMKERTLLFDTNIEPEYLLIEGMHYMKAYNNVIEIPVD